MFQPLFEHLLRVRSSTRAEGMQEQGGQGTKRVGIGEEQRTKRHNR